MTVAGVALPCVLPEQSSVAHTDLAGGGSDDHAWHVVEVSQERAEEFERAKLHSQTEPDLWVHGLLFDPGFEFLIEDEMLGELGATAN